MSDTVPRNERKQPGWEDHLLHVTVIRSTSMAIMTAAKCNVRPEGRSSETKIQHSRGLFRWFLPSFFASINDLIGFPSFFSFFFSFFLPETRGINLSSWFAS